VGFKTNFAASAGVSHPLCWCLF